MKAIEEAPSTTAQARQGKRGEVQRLCRLGILVHTFFLALLLVSDLGEEASAIKTEIEEGNRS
jgi:hypothetical protein